MYEDQLALRKRTIVEGRTNVALNGAERADAIFPGAAWKGHGVKYGSPGRLLEWSGAPP